MSESKFSSGVNTAYRVAVLTLLCVTSAGSILTLWSDGRYMLKSDSMARWIKNDESHVYISIALSNLTSQIQILNERFMAHITTPKI